MDAVQKARSGHPGMPMGMAPSAYVLWTKHLRYNPQNPQWLNRDRFVLSAGHGCMLLYSLLHLTGFDLPLEEIKNFRQWGSRTPGHPEYGHTPGVEVTTGPLGQGLANAVGMAIAEKYLSAYFNRDGFPLIDYRTYVIAGDGCMQEGVAAEACSLAGHLGLEKLIVLYDDNRISIDGPTKLSFSEDVAQRFTAYGWYVQTVDGEGNDLEAIDRALGAAKAETSRPSLIKIRTHIGYGSPHKQDTAEVHGSPLGEEEVALTKVQLGWDPAALFAVPNGVAASMHHRGESGREEERRWKQLLEKYREAHRELHDTFLLASEKKMPAGWDGLWEQHLPKFEAGTSMATREAQGKILDALMPSLPLVLGGSADLTPSNNTRYKGVTDFSREQPLGRYLRYGVREHAMGAIMNGIAVGGMLVPYGGTFFVFSDYMRPAIRLAAMARYPVIFVFTHDSIGLGEDGPTHQPVEHLAAVRTIPGLVVLRPADANETAWAWKFALEHRTGPTVLALSRQKIPIADRSVFASARDVTSGGYVLADVPAPRVILIGTGSEVSLALAARERLTADGIPARVVSMPSWELFEQQSEAYRNAVLPPSLKERVVVEAGVRQGWERYLGPRGIFVGMSGFGASAPFETAYKHFGITTEAVVEAARSLIT
jgi:transketolase